MAQTEKQEVDAYKRSFIELLPFYGIREHGKTTFSGEKLKIVKDSSGKYMFKRVPTGTLERIMNQIADSLQK
ncbi:MAG TPA: hypothetical protein VJ179_02175 [Patescibacteria group bacterium]|nr:hypothetical protein [Patescibacteria group bacterium]